MKMGPLALCYHITLDFLLLLSLLDVITAVGMDAVLRNEDFSEICIKKEKEHIGYVLYDYKPLYDGCTLKCYLLTYSSWKYIDYFDETKEETHFFNGNKCRDDQHICSYGSCKPIETITSTTTIIPTWKGNVFLYIKDGHFRSVDANEKSPPDTYIKFLHEW